MKSDWQTVKLGDVFEIGSSKRVHKKDWAQEGVPFYRAREIVKLAKNGFVENDLFITEELFEKFEKITGSPKAGDLMVTAVGTLGICYLVTAEDRFYFKDASVLWFQPKTEISTRYVEYLFQSPEIVKLSNDNKGATVGTLTISRAKTLPIPLPPLPEQERIVSILDKAFEGIDKAIAHTEQNLASARELFESYLNNIFTQKGDDWRTAPLKGLCENFKSDIVDGPFGANLKREHYKESGIPVLKIQNIKPFEIVQKKMDHVDDAKAEELKRHNYKKGDIIITKLGLPLGVSAIVEDIEDGVIVADLVRVRANKVNTKYLCYHLNSPVTNAFLNEQQGGSTRPRVRITAVRELPINVPPLPEQERIVAILDRLKSSTQQLETLYTQKLNDLKELKQSLLQKAFAGELTKEDAA